MNAIQSTFNLLFVVRKHRLLKNGEAPIYLRITINGEIADITVGRSVRSEMWDQRRECSFGKLHRDKELNHYLETVKTRLYQIHREFEIDGIPITARGMRDRYLGRDDSSKTIGDVYREHNRKCRALIGIDYRRRPWINSTLRCRICKSICGISTARMIYCCRSLTGRSLRTSTST